MKQVSKTTNRGTTHAVKKKTNKDSRLPKTSSASANRKRGLEKKKMFDKNKNHPQYGTSKLEEDFARDFLDKLGVEYEYQFEAKEIGRFYDFYLPNSRILIEIDGDYFHSNPLIYEDKDLNQMQKRNKVIDEVKNKWALLHGYPIIRIWEHDIRKNPSQVMKELKKVLYIEDKKAVLKENKNKRHNNKL